MKIVKEIEKLYRPVTMRLPEQLMKQIDKIAKENRVSRQSFVAAVLKQVLEDKNFILKIKE